LGAACAQSAEDDLPKALSGETAWLARFGHKDWRAYLRKAAQDYKFEKTLGPRLDRAEADWHASQPQAPEPVIVHHEIDEKLQTGESRLLGGAMSIHAPWSDEPEQNQAD
jgi:hypothetical protein